MHPQATYFSAVSLDDQRFIFELAGAYQFLPTRASTCSGSQRPHTDLEQPVLVEEKIECDNQSIEA